MAEDTRLRVNWFMMDEQSSNIALLASQWLLTYRAEYVLGNLIYEGYAYPWTTELLTWWIIIKYEYDVDWNILSKKFIDTQWAFENVWDSRSWYTYL